MSVGNSATPDSIRQSQTCCICFDDDVKTSVASCGDPEHRVCSDCLTSHVQSTCDLEDTALLPEIYSRKGQVPCPGFRCQHNFTSKALFSVLGQESCELAVEAANAAARQEGKLEALRELSLGDKGTQNQAVLVAELKTSFPDAVQCGRCGVGPVVHHACSDLTSHHGRDGINNACAACGWFSEDINDWPRWEGKLSPQYLARSKERSSGLSEQLGGHIQHLFWDHLGATQTATDWFVGSLLIWAAVSFIAHVGVEGWLWFFSGTASLTWATVYCLLSLVYNVFHYAIFYVGYYVCFYVSYYVCFYLLPLVWSISYRSFACVGMMIGHTTVYSLSLAYTSCAPLLGGLLLAAGWWLYSSCEQIVQDYKQTRRYRRFVEKHPLDFLPSFLLPQWTIHRWQISQSSLSSTPMFVRIIAEARLALDCAFWQCGWGDGRRNGKPTFTFSSWS